MPGERIQRRRARRLLVGVVLALVLYGARADPIGDAFRQGCHDCLRAAVPRVDFSSTSGAEEFVPPSGPSIVCVGLAASATPRCRPAAEGTASVGEPGCTDAGRIRCVAGDLVCDRGEPTCGGVPTSRDPEAGARLASLRTVAITMESLSPLVRRCVGDTDATVEIRGVLVGTSGRIERAEVAEPFGHAEVGACIARALASGRFPRFRQSSTPVAYRFLPERPRVTDAVGALERVTTDPEDERAPSASQTGTLVFTIAGHRQSDQSLQSLIAVRSGEARRVVLTGLGDAAMDPAWGPDGLWLVYASAIPDAAAVMRSATEFGSAPRFIRSAASPRAPAVSPDGSHVAFSVDLRAERWITICATDGTACTALGEGDHPAWSPDGLRLAYDHAFGRGRQIFTVDARSRGDRVQLTEGAADAIDPTFSPDGRWVMYTSNAGWDLTPGATEAGTWNLYAAALPSGRTRARVTHGKLACIDPAWSSDGWVYFASNARGQLDIWRLRPAAPLPVARGSERH